MQVFDPYHREQDREEAPAPDFSLVQQWLLGPRGVSQHMENCSVSLSHFVCGSVFLISRYILTVAGLCSTICIIFNTVFSSIQLKIHLSILLACSVKTVKYSFESCSVCKLQDIMTCSMCMQAMEKGRCCSGSSCFCLT